MKDKKMFMFALAAQGEGISGSDRIFIELSRRWKKKTDIEIITWSEGARMINRQHLKKSSNLKITSLSVPFSTIPFINYISRIIESVSYGFTLKINNPKQTVLYNGSEFWMDSFPCAIIKWRYPESRWIATWYQTAPNPLKGFSEKERVNKHRVKAFMYWFMQQPVKILIRFFADKVIVNNEKERQRFPAFNNDNKTIVLIGAVPLGEIDKYKKNMTNITTKFDAVFQGRFHPQKGVSELVDIWRDVVKKAPKATLAMIGDGPEMFRVKNKISKYKLEKNIRVYGYMFDGDKKFSILANSSMVLHPAYYDSGGMAAAEAMAFGIPCIGFNLPSYESYYPKGMIKVKNEKEFTKVILDFISNPEKRKKIGNEAEKLIYEKYSWDARAKEILDKIYE